MRPLDVFLIQHAAKQSATFLQHVDGVVVGDGSGDQPFRLSIYLVFNTADQLQRPFQATLTALEHCTMFSHESIPQRGDKFVLHAAHTAHAGVFVAVFLELDALAANGVGVGDGDDRLTAARAVRVASDATE